MKKTRLKVVLVLCGLVLIAIGILLMGPVIGSYYYPDINTGDCMWSVEVNSWIDENENGRWDSNEVALPGVEFFVDDILNERRKIDHALSDGSGKAYLNAWLPGCPERVFEIYPELSNDYRLTTMNRIRVDLKVGIYEESKSSFTFGFVKDDTK